MKNLTLHTLFRFSSKGSMVQFTILAVYSLDNIQLRYKTKAFQTKWPDTNCFTYVILLGIVSLSCIMYCLHFCNKLI